MANRNSFGTVEPEVVLRFMDPAVFMRRSRHPIDPAYDIELVCEPFEPGVCHGTGARAERTARNRCRV